MKKITLIYIVSFLLMGILVMMMFASFDYNNAKRELNNALYFSKNKADTLEATKKLLDIERNERTREDIENGSWHSRK